MQTSFAYDASILAVGYSGNHDVFDADAEEGGVLNTRNSIHSSSRPTSPAVLTDPLANCFYRLRPQANGMDPVLLLGPTGIAVSETGGSPRPHPHSPCSHAPQWIAYRAARCVARWISPRAE